MVQRFLPCKRTASAITFVIQQRYHRCITSWGKLTDNEKSSMFDAFRGQAAWRNEDESEIERIFHHKAFERLSVCLGRLVRVAYNDFGLEMVFGRSCIGTGLLINLKIYLIRQREIEHQKRVGAYIPVVVFPSRSGQNVWLAGINEGCKFTRSTNAPILGRMAST